MAIFNVGDWIIMDREPTSADWSEIGQIPIPEHFFTTHLKVLNSGPTGSRKSSWVKLEGTEGSFPASCFSRIDQAKGSSDNERILAEAKTKFKPGCRYISINGTEEKSTYNDSPYIYDTSPCLQIAMTPGCGLIYKGGIWAEVITERSLIKEAKERYPKGTFFFSAQSGRKGEAFHDYEYDESEDKLCDDGWAVYYKGKWAEITEQECKFKVGDKIIGNVKANKNYDITTEGWIGYVYQTGSEIEVGGSEDKNKSTHHFWVDPECFDLYPYSVNEESLISSSIKTSENGKAKHDDSERVIKVSQPDFEVSRGNQIRGSRINSSTSEVSIGNRHRNYETRSIRG